MVDDDFERELVEALPRMNKTAGLYLRPGDDPRDVVQEAALRAWANRHQFRGDSHFSSWAHSIIRNVVREIHRRKHASTRPSEVSMPDCFDAIDERLTRPHEDWPIVEGLLSTLPRHLQIATELHLSDSDPGPTSTNKVRYHRAILLLRKKLCRRQSTRASLASSVQVTHMFDQERASAIVSSDVGGHQGPK